MNTLKLNIKIIIGSTRKNRFSEKPANWLYQELRKVKGVEIELLDLRDYPLPFFDEPMSPAWSKGNYSNAVVKKWAAKVAEADAYIIVTPEYNHGYPAVLKNALDYVYYEWNKKPVGFVSYGGVGGARAIEQLRQVAIELQMVPIRTALHFPLQVYLEVINNKEKDEYKPFESMNEQLQDFFDQLIWWSKALKNAREEDK